jgi:hypothetical protein
VTGPVPPRVLAAERRREFRDLLSRSSLGCPADVSCGHVLSEHVVEDYADDTGEPIRATCSLCDCEMPS